MSPSLVHICKTRMCHCVIVSTITFLFILWSNLESSSFFANMFCPCNMLVTAHFIITVSFFLDYLLFLKLLKMWSCNHFLRFIAQTHYCSRTSNLEYYSETFLITLPEISLYQRGAIGTEPRFDHFKLLGSQLNYMTLSRSKRVASVWLAPISTLVAYSIFALLVLLCSNASTWP